MKKNWLIVHFVICVLAVLYFIEVSKMDSGGVNNMPTLDHLETDEIAKDPCKTCTWKAYGKDEFCGSRCHVRRKYEYFRKLI